jgi:hypothetical protein
MKRKKSCFNSNWILTLARAVLKKIIQKETANKDDIRQLSNQNNYAAFERRKYKLAIKRQHAELINRLNKSESKHL